MKQFDVITVGDALIDTFLTIDQTSKYCSIDHATGNICFTSGAKVLVSNTDFLLGGNACNVGVGLARLGLTTALAAEIGDDEFSQKIQSGLEKDSVVMDLLKKTLHTQSTFSVCLNFVEDRTLFVHHVERTHDISFTDVTASWVYLTSLGNQWHDLYARVGAFVTSTHAKLVFSPGSTQLKEGRESFKDILALSYVLVVNKEEAEEILYGVPQHTENPANSVETLLHELQKLGPHIVCITDGEKGSYCIDSNGEMYTQGILPATFIEKTGAGDAYATGFLAALIHGESVPTAMKWGAGESASVIEHMGAQPGLLTKEGLQARIEKVYNEHLPSN